MGRSLALGSVGRHHIFGPGTDRDGRGQDEKRVPILSEPQQPSRRRRARRSDAPRTERLNLRLNASELRSIQLAAERANLSPAAYVAGRAVAVARGEISPLPADEQDRAKEVRDSRTAVKRIGTNINQIATVMNAEGLVPPPQLEAAAEAARRAIERLDDATIVLMERYNG
ncbi:plasmid mobilization relaxosome protein MobC [Streptomyces sp. NPDC001633]|uniref:plasmid mobilization relaxosome protein MobC n=1 Tax=Streptomyces sp. NPDC001633 TaxID=3364595 RepID=UPI00368AB4D3